VPTINAISSTIGRTEPDTAECTSAVVPAGWLFVVPGEVVTAGRLALPEPARLAAGDGEVDVAGLLLRDALGAGDGDRAGVTAGSALLGNGTWLFCAATSAAAAFV
jgi:hypothetical protein